jgi:hypothetical protein
MRAGARTLTIEPLEWIMEYGIRHSSKLNPISTESKGSLLESVQVDYEAKKNKSHHG